MYILHRIMLGIWIIFSSPILSLSYLPITYFYFGLRFYPETDLVPSLIRIGSDKFFSLGSSPLFLRPGIKICFMLNPDPNLFRIFWLAALILFLYCGGAGQRVLPGRLGHHYLPQVGGAYNPEVLWPLIGIWLCQAGLLLAIRRGLVKHGVYRIYGRCMHGVHCFTRDIYYENFAKEQRRKLHQKRSKMP